MHGLARIVLAAAFCLLVRVDLARPEMIDRTVAMVNGEIILYSDLQAQIDIMLKVMPQLKTDDPVKKAQLERDILQQLIRQRLVEAEAKRLKIQVMDHEIDEAIAQMKASSKLSAAQFQKQMEASGQKMDKLREDIKRELERNRLLERSLKQKTIITDQQVDAAMKTGSMPSKPSQAPAAIATGRDELRLGIILLTGKDAEKKGREVLGRLKSGEDFGQLARQNSMGPSADAGGDIGYISMDEIDPALAGAVKGLKKGGVSDLVKAEKGCYILKVLDTRKETVAAGAAASIEPADNREKVRQRLFEQEVTRKFEEWVGDLESKAFIKISL